MFRRTNGKPPFLVGGLVLFLLILIFSYWTLNTQNNDLLQSLEKLQANLKIGEVKIEQNERKMSALQDLLHEKEETVKQEENKLIQQEDDIKTFNNDLKKSDYEITSLKNDIDQLHAKLQLLEDKFTECEGDNEKILRENDLIMSQRDDAVTALNKRDEHIADTSRKLEQEREHNRQLEANMGQVNKQLALVHAQLSNAKQDADAPHPSVANHSNGAAAPGAGMSSSRGGVAVQPQTLSLHPPQQPQADAALGGEQQQQQQQQPPQQKLQQQYQAAGEGSLERRQPQEEREVLAPPPNFIDNLDAAIDEGNRLGDDPLMPDEDPEGVLHNEALLQDDRVHENRVHDDRVQNDNSVNDPRLQGFGGNDGGLIRQPDPYGNVKLLNNPEFVDEAGNVIAVPEVVHNNNNNNNGIIGDNDIKGKVGDGLEEFQLKGLDNGVMMGPVDNPLLSAKDNDGGEIETGNKNEPLLPDEDNIDNRAKENFFGENPPLRIQMHKTEDDIRNNINNRRDHSLDDNMVLDAKNSF